MSDICMNVPFPLDEDGFLRRQCPLCSREFKLKPTPAELRSVGEEGSHALVGEGDTSDQEAGSDGPADRWCPYCGQQAPASSWFTEEQVAYIQEFARNVAARMLNEHLIGPMKRAFGTSRSGLVTVEVKTTEMNEREPWISPEPNDMSRLALPCCDREVKVSDDWNERVHCFFCGFPHDIASVGTNARRP